MRPIKQSAVISTHALIYFSPLSTSLLAVGPADPHPLLAGRLSLRVRLHARLQLPRGQVREAGAYWKRRFMAVGLVYLVWSVIYWPVAPPKARRASRTFASRVGHLSRDRAAQLPLRPGDRLLPPLLPARPARVLRGLPVRVPLIRRYPRSHLLRRSWRTRLAVPLPLRRASRAGSASSSRRSSRRASSSPTRSTCSVA